MERPSLTIRTSTPGTTTETTPLVIPTGVSVPGRARPAGPLRREGPDKLTGAAKYADDLVFPGAWYGITIRSTEPHARFVGIELDDAFDWKRVVVVTADDIPGENIVSLISDDQPVLVPVGGEIQHQAEPCALVAAPDLATVRAARHHIRLRTERLPAVFDPLEVGPRVRALHGRARRRGHRHGERRPRDRGHVSGRPPGAAVHREPGDDRRPARGRRDHRPRLAPVPVLHPQGDEARARHGRQARGRGAGGDRRRVRGQGGVPVGAGAPRLTPGAQVR